MLMKAGIMKDEDDSNSIQKKTIIEKTITFLMNKEFILQLAQVFAYKHNEFCNN